MVSETSVYIAYLLSVDVHQGLTKCSLTLMSEHFVSLRCIVIVTECICRAT